MDRRGARALRPRACSDAAARRTGAALDAALDELGWADALASTTRAAVSVLFEVQGRGGGHVRRARRRARHGARASPRRRRAAAARAHDTARAARRRRPIDVAGLATAAIDAGGRAVVVCAADDGLVRGHRRPDGLARRAVRGLDPALGLVEVSGSPAPATTRPIPPAAWEDAVAAGQRALAHELVGASRGDARPGPRAHAVERIQFGVPIAAFQAVRHRLAEASWPSRRPAPPSTPRGTSPSPLTAAVAKAIAGRSARLVARHCQQVLAGIGFTTEHPLHRYVRRVLVLDGLLGDARSLTRQVGERLLQDRGLPAILPLTQP